MGAEGKSTSLLTFLPLLSALDDLLSHIVAEEDVGGEGALRLGVRVRLCRDREQGRAVSDQRLGSARIQLSSPLR